MRVSFEQEIKDFFREYEVDYEDNTGSTDKLDFMYSRHNFIFKFDAKEKMQNYNMANWTDQIPEKDCFILDELGVRKVMYSGRDSGIIIRNNMIGTGEYVFLSFLDLFCMPKIRANRITNDLDYLKGKWIIDMNNGVRCNTFKEVLSAVRKYEGELENWFFQGQCFGNYVGETIEIKGTRRTAYYKYKDFTGTR